jgi:hypothetical protein
MSTSMRSHRGITNAQAKFLADLQRDLGEPYTGRGMTRLEAAATIDGLLDRRRELRRRLQDEARAEAVRPPF